MMPVFRARILSAAQAAALSGDWRSDDRFGAPYGLAPILLSDATYAVAVAVENAASYLGVRAALRAISQRDVDTAEFVA